MLVLSLLANGQLVIDDDIIITAVEIGNDKVRLGIEAPKDIAVYRARVYASIQGRRTERPVYSGWAVVYATPDPTHPFVERLLRVLRDRYRGLRATTEHHPVKSELTVFPPKRTGLAESDRVGVEIESLIEQVYRAVEQELNEAEGPDRPD